MTTHFWSHDAFCAPPLLEQVGKLASIPGTLIHGRQDISSPAVTACGLHRRWPGSQLIIDDGDGHGGNTMNLCWEAANARLLHRIDAGRT